MNTTKSNQEIKNLLAWGEAKEVHTAYGKRLLRKATPTSTFWGMWRREQSKNDLKGSGISLSKNPKTQEWEVCWWENIDPAPVAQPAPVTAPAPTLVLDTPRA